MRDVTREEVINDRANIINNLDLSVKCKNCGRTLGSHRILENNHPEDKKDILCDDYGYYNGKLRVRITTDLLSKVRS